MTTLGGPGGQMKIYKPSPPERGSFPLDHEAECKSFMAPYLRCLKDNRGQNSAECRQLAKAYLTCRMEKNLMAPDEFRNLGFSEAEIAKATGGPVNQASSAGPAGPSGSSTAQQGEAGG